MICTYNTFSFRAIAIFNENFLNARSVPPRWRDGDNGGMVRTIYWNKLIYEEITGEKEVGLE